MWKGSNDLEEEDMMDQVSLEGSRKRARVLKCSHLTQEDNRCTMAQSSQSESHKQDKEHDK